ncbi:MAG: Crp/Fnr family transcriptional regulator [Candidatus Dormibacteraceae bacterium]
MIKRMESAMLSGSRPSAVALARPEYVLLQHPLLLGAQEAKLAPLLARIPIQRAPKGTQLNNPGLSGGFLHLVLLGRLKAYQVSAVGDELVLELIGPGGFDGLLPACGLQGHFTEAVEDSLLALVTAPTLERMIALEPRIASRLWRLVAGRLAAREGQLQALALQDPMRRLAKLLLSFGEATRLSRGSTGTIRRLSHELLGNMLAMRAIAIGLHLRRLVGLGAIQVAHDSFQLDLEALQRVVDEAQPPPPLGA